MESTDNALAANHHDAQKIEQLRKMQTFGPIGEPGDGGPQQQAASASANANGEPLHFTMLYSGECVKVTGAADGSKEAARVPGLPASNGWVGVQVGNELFQVEDGSNRCRWVALSGGAVREEKPLISEDTYFTLCKLDNSHVFVCGGMSSKSAQRFNLQTKLWEAMPQMNEPRANAGSVALNGTVYVFCGQKGEDSLNSVEKMVNAGGPQ